MSGRAPYISAAILSLTALLAPPVMIGWPRIAALAGGGTDTVSSATLDIPDMPSGSYVILINTDRHPDTLSDWEAFFREEPVGVIFEDIDCLVIDADVSGRELAERYRLRLAEHQLTLHTESSLMAASMAQWGAFDMMIVSAEMAEAVELNTVSGNDSIRTLLVEDTAS